MHKHMIVLYVAAVIFTTAFSGCRWQHPQNIEPSVWTQGADSITESNATIKGSVNPNGSATTGWFEWGTDPTLATFTETSRTTLGTGVTALDILADLNNLAPGTIFYYRAVAMNSKGTTTGNIGTFSTKSPDTASIIVTTLIDENPTPTGAMTLRKALEQIQSGGTITFDPGLNNGIIKLTLIGSDISPLKGEVYTLSMGWVFEGFQQRKYGKSALNAQKNVTIDASGLPDGITLQWNGGETSRARVLAVYGNLTMKNVAVTSGYAQNEPLSDENQPYTLARGGGIAVWGTAVLENCILYGNTAHGDENPARDRGAFGGGIYADILTLSNCIVSGNSVMGFGAAGGGVYSVGGADGWGQGSTLTGCAITGNHVTAQHAYGGGVYSDGGGPGNGQTLQIKNSTIARNLVEDHPGIDQDEMYQYYYRGGGVYMSNGYLYVAASTIAENKVTGHPKLFKSKTNMGGGGIGATIGNAHVVENMQLQHSIIAGNTVNDAPDDVYTGSLLHFYSWGYNLIGALDFSQILVPIPDWNSLSRKHWPKKGDADGIAAGDVLSLEDITRHSSIKSVGTDAGENTVLWYRPIGKAIDQLPLISYRVFYYMAQYEVGAGKTDDFLNHVIEKVRTKYGDILGADFGQEFGDMTGVTWYGPSQGWPSNPANAQWIKFWRDLDAAIGNSLGAVQLGDAFWGTFTSGPVGENITITVESRVSGFIEVNPIDQRGNLRPVGSKADIGAIEAD